MRLFFPRPPARPCSAIVRWTTVLACAVGVARGAVNEGPALASFNRQAEPLLDQYCYNCHGDGAKKGGVQLDAFSSDADVHNHALWFRVFKNVRAGLMPPAGEPRMSEAERRQLMTWIKRDALSLDPEHPDPGRVALHRLNRAEYRNSVRELTGVDFDTQKEFPADDTGQGFDNIASVLTISPMLLERYLDAAQAIIAQAVPLQEKVVAKHEIPGRQFTLVGSLPAAAQGPFKRPAPKASGESLDLSYYTPATVAASFKAEEGGRYQVAVSLHAVEAYVDDQFDLNRCRLTLRIDGQEVQSQEFVREGDKAFDFSFERAWQPGEHAISVQVQPVAPDRDQKRQLRLRLGAVTVTGPMDPAHYVEAPAYARFFPKPVPWWPAARRRYAAELLEGFASRAFRRPVDPGTLKRLVGIEESVSAQPGGSFEAGVAQAMTAVLASPRFILREENAEPLRAGQVYPYVDAYALASRLSYFLWSSMPDAELFRLAASGQLRDQVPAQLRRMLADPRSEEFVRNFTGQWLEARDIPTVQINPIAVYMREHPDPALDKAMDAFRRLNRIPEEKRSDAQKEELKAAMAVALPFFRSQKPQLTDALRDAMRQETEMTFAYVVREDRDLAELVESHYTFLNEDLARHYGISGVTGKQMRRVELAPDNPRGGILTQGTVLAVTSNPTRTSPVKRGVFVLDAILGTRPPPPPPNIPALEDAASPEKLRTMTLRENLALHATNKMCASCHSRMDPLGLALENFNAMGAWRDGELGRPIDPSGKLVTGETFADVRELKHILATRHRRDFYTCLTEKLLTYALGRTLDYYDVETVDRLVDRLEANGGRPSELLLGIVQSAPFQQRRQTPVPEMADASEGPSPEKVPH